MFNTKSAGQNHLGNSVQVISYFTSFSLWNNQVLHFMAWKTICYQFSDNILIIVWCSEQFQWMMSHPQNSLLSREQIWDANQWEFNYALKDRCSVIHRAIYWQHSIKHKLNAHFYTQLSLPHLHQLSPSCTHAPGSINQISHTVNASWLPSTTVCHTKELSSINFIFNVVASFSIFTSLLFGLILFFLKTASLWSLTSFDSGKMGLALLGCGEEL